MAQGTLGPHWELPEPMLLDSKDSENGTCFQNHALQQQVAEKQARAMALLSDRVCMAPHKKSACSLQWPLDEQPQRSAMLPSTLSRMYLKQAR